MQGALLAMLAALAQRDPNEWGAKQTWEGFRKNSIKSIVPLDKDLLDKKNLLSNNQNSSFVCFSENLFRTMADLVVSEGYAEVGYEYINVDDCWLEKSRGQNGELVADRRRFPHGMKALGQYVSK